MAEDQESAVTPRFYCATGTRCGLCQFPFAEVGDYLFGAHSTLIAIGDDGDFAQLSPVFAGGEVHFCGTPHCKHTDVWPDAVKTTGFHTRCLSSCGPRVNPAGVAALQPSFDPPGAEDQRRHVLIQEKLAATLAASTEWPRKLPAELWLQIADLLVFECAAVMATQLELACAGADHESPLDLTQPVYASYVNVYGRRYVKSLRNTAEPDGEWVPTAPILPGFPGVGDSDLGDVFLARDHLGIRQVVHITPDSRDAWRNRPPVPGLWWARVTREDLGLKRPPIAITKSDGLKLRCLQVQYQSGHPMPPPPVEWDVPVVPAPKVIGLMHPEERPCCWAGLQMRSLNCNAPDVMGYFVHVDQAGVKAIIPHISGQDLRLSQRRYGRGGWPCTSWTHQYMPIDRGEYLTNISSVLRDDALKDEIPSIILATNRGQSIVFGPFRPLDTCRKGVRLITCLPPTPSRLFFNAHRVSEHRNWICSAAIEQPATPFPEPLLYPINLSTPGYLGRGTGWLYSQCMLDGVREIQPCIDKSMPHKPALIIIGLLLYYADGHRESLGSIIPQWLAERVHIAIKDQIYVLTGDGYVLDVTAAPKRPGPRWVEVPQVGRLEWWMYSGSDCLFHNGVRLESDDPNADGYV